MDIGKLLILPLLAATGCRAGKDALLSTKDHNRLWPMAMAAECYYYTSGKLPSSDRDIDLITKQLDKRLRLPPGYSLKYMKVNLTAPELEQQIGRSKLETNEVLIRLEIDDPQGHVVQSSNSVLHLYDRHHDIPNLMLCDNVASQRLVLFNNAINLCNAYISTLSADGGKRLLAYKSGQDDALVKRWPNEYRNSVALLDRVQQDALLKVTEDDTGIVVTVSIRSPSSQTCVYHINRAGAISLTSTAP